MKLKTQSTKKGSCRFDAMNLNLQDMSVTGRKNLSTQYRSQYHPVGWDEYMLSMRQRDPRCHSNRCERCVNWLVSFDRKGRLAILFKDV